MQKGFWEAMKHIKSARPCKQSLMCLHKFLPHFYRIKSETMMLWTLRPIVHAYDPQYTYLHGFSETLSRHKVVCRGPRKWGTCKLREHINRNNKVGFSRIHNSVIFYLMNARVAVEVPAYQGRPHTKFEEYCLNHFWDMSEQTLVFFLLFTQTKKLP